MDVSSAFLPFSCVDHVCMSKSVILSRGGFGIPDHMESMQTTLVVTMEEGTLLTSTEQE